VSDPILQAFVPEVSPCNPLDVADLFESLQVQHLRYREFPRPEGPTFESPVEKLSGPMHPAQRSSRLRA